MNFNFLKGFFSLREIWRSQTKDKVFLSIDIGTEAIKALIFSVESSGKRIIILTSAIEYFDKYGAFEFKNPETDATKRTIEKIVNDLKRGVALSLAKKDLKKKVLNQKKWQVFLTISPDKLKARISRQNFVRANLQIKIQKKEEKEILDQILTKSQKEVSQNFLANASALPDDIFWVSSEIISKKIDGYQIAELAGFEGKLIEFEILNVFCAKYYFEEIKKAFSQLNLEILKVIHIVENIKFLEEGAPQANFYIDIGGQVTQFFLTYKGAIKQIGEFASGGKKFTEILSQDLGITEEFAREFKEKYAAGGVKGNSAEKIRNLFELEKNRWFSLLKSEFGKISNQDILPQNIRIFGGASMLPEIKEYLKEQIAQSAQNLPNSSVDAEIIYPSDLKNIENLSKSVKNSQFLPVSLNCFSALTNKKLKI